MVNDATASTFGLASAFTRPVGAAVSAATTSTSRRDRSWQSRVASPRGDRVSFVQAAFLVSLGFYLRCSRSASLWA
jgi:hypothetical protein